MLGYILVQYNLDTKRYQGFRMGEEDTIQSPDELFVTMEEFALWTHYQPPPPIGPHEKREQLIQLFAQSSLPVRIAFADVATKVYTALGSEDVELAIHFVNEAGKTPGANQAVIAAMLSVLEGS
jgi:hypothetical protein